jgi:hypothetical protein
LQLLKKFDLVVYNCFVHTPNQQQITAVGMQKQQARWHCPTFIAWQSYKIEFEILKNPAFFNKKEPSYQKM